MNDDMKIAWRYNNMNKIDLEQGSSQQKNSYVFDLTQSIDSDTVKELDFTLFGDDQHLETTNSLFGNPIYSALLDKLKKRISDEAFNPNVQTTRPVPQVSSNTLKKNLLRICIESLGSPVWYDENFTSDLCLFLTILKAIVRTSLSVCCISVPAHLFHHIVSESYKTF